MDLTAFALLFIALLALLLAALALSRANHANARHDLRDRLRSPARPTESPKLNEPGDPDRP